MARLKFGRAISLRWNGLLLEGPAETVFEIPDEYYEEFEEDIHPVEPTLVWLDSDEGDTIRDRLDALEALGGGGGASLSNDNPVALGTTAPGSGLTASRYDHVHPTTGLALSGHNHAGVYDPAGTAASAVATHEAASDPHPTYLTDAEGDAQYSQLGHTHETAGYTTIIKQYVKNDSTPKSKGEAVYISSADGTNPIVSYADADTEATSSKTLGLLEQNLSANQHGWVVTEGVLTNIDTSAATAGQSVWLSGTAGGRVYGAPPAEPAHGVYLGVVTKANVSTGEIFVKVQNGYELNELHDVSTGSAVSGDVIQYDGSMWNNKSLSAAGISATSHNHNGTYANLSHSHVEGDVTNLTTDLAGKAPLSHTHAQSDVTNLTSTLAGKSDTGHTHSGVYDPAGTASSAITTHESAGDPHPGYLTSAEGDAAYATTGHSHSYVTSATGTTNQVNVSSSTGAVTFSLPQSIATTSTPTFGGLTVSSNFAITTPVYANYDKGGSADSTTITTAGTYYALTNSEVSFTPQFVGQRFLLTYTAYASLNTTTVQYCFVRANITDSSNVIQGSDLGFSRSDNFSSSGRGATVAFTKIWVADTTSARKFKLYGTAQTTNGLTLSLSYTQMTVISLN